MLSCLKPSNTPHLTSPLIRYTALWHTLQYIAYNTPHYNTPHYITLHQITPRHTTPHYAPLHCRQWEERLKRQRREHAGPDTQLRTQTGQNRHHCASPRRRLRCIQQWRSIRSEWGGRVGPFIYPHIHAFLLQGDDDVLCSLMHEWRTILFYCVCDACGAVCILSWDPRVNVMTISAEISKIVSRIQCDCQSPTSWSDYSRQMFVDLHR